MQINKLGMCLSLPWVYLKFYLDVPFIRFKTHSISEIE